MASQNKFDEAKPAELAETPPVIAHGGSSLGRQLQPGGKNIGSVSCATSLTGVDLSEGWTRCVFRSMPCRQGAENRTASANVGIVR